MSAPTIKMDLLHDWATYLRGKLAKDGKHLPAKASDDEVCLVYYDYMMRFPSSRKRRILKSPNFVCPVECQNGLHELERKMSSGEDLRPHLSKRAKKLSKHDPMLLEWGIYHFHLDLPDAKKKGTRHLLYARLTEDAVYVIGVLEHGQWTNPDLIRVLYLNWPESMASYQLPGIVELDRKITQSDRGEFRKKNINTDVEVAPGIIYGPLGGGVVASGKPLVARLKADKDRQWFDDVEERIRARWAEWISVAKDPAGLFRFSLEIIAGSFYAVDRDHGVAVKVSE